MSFSQSEFANSNLGVSGGKENDTGGTSPGLDTAVHAKDAIDEPRERGWLHHQGHLLPVKPLPSNCHRMWLMLKYNELKRLQGTATIAVSYTQSYPPSHTPSKPPTVWWLSPLLPAPSTAGTLLVPSRNLPSGSTIGRMRPWEGGGY